MGLAPFARVIDIWRPHLIGMVVPRRGTDSSLTGEGQVLGRANVGHAFTEATRAPALEGARVAAACDGEMLSARARLAHFT